MVFSFEICVCIQPLKIEFHSETYPSFKAMYSHLLSFKPSNFWPTLQYVKYIIIGRDNSLDMVVFHIHTLNIYLLDFTDIEFKLGITVDEYIEIDRKLKMEFPQDINYYLPEIEL